MTYQPRPIYPKKVTQRDPRIPAVIGSPPICTTLCAPRKSGKSALVCGLIQDIYAAVFDKVIIMSDTVEYDASIQELARTTKHGNIYFTDEVNNGTIAEIVEEQKKSVKKSLLLFIDDAGDSAQSKELNKELSKLYTKGRHWNISTIVAIQSVTGQLSRKMKNCTTEWIIFKNNAEDLKLLAKVLCSAYKSEKEVLAYLNECTQQPYSFCYINISAGNAKEMYRYCDKTGFHDYFS